MGIRIRPLLGRRVPHRFAPMFAVAIAAAACQAVDPPIRLDAIFFPQPPPHAGPSVVMAALGHGTLALKDGCLWLESGDARALIIWPSSFRLQIRGGHIAVLDATGSEFAEVGRDVAIGGGAVTNEGSAIDVNVWIESKIGRAIPPACRVGRYWDAAGRPANVP